MSIDVGTGASKRIAQDLYLGFFGWGYRGRSALVIEQDGVIGTKDKVYRLTGERLEPLAYFDTTEISDFVEWQQDTFYFTNSSEGVIYRLAKGVITQFCSGLQRPANLAPVDQYLYCLDETGRILYRLDAIGNAYQTALPSAGSDAGPTRRALGVRGFAAVSAGVLNLIENAFIVEVDVSKARWRKAMGK
jgi:hypothetical protein